MPTKVSTFFNAYTRWIQNIQPNESQAVVMQSLKKGLLQIFINLIIIIGIFAAGFYFAHSPNYQFLIPDFKLRKALIWGAALIFSLPFLTAIYRKIRGLSMILAELSVKPNGQGEYNVKMRRLITEIIPIISMFGIGLVLLILSASILPPIDLLMVVAMIALVLMGLFWRWFIKLHSKLQIIFMGRFKDPDKKD